MIAVELQLQTVVDGHQWNLYSFEFVTADGVFSSYLYALSDDHAQLVLDEMKATAEAGLVACVTCGQPVESGPGASGERPEAADGGQMARDAGRYRWLRRFTAAGRNSMQRQQFVFPYVSPAGLDLFHGSVAQHLDAAIDASMKEQP